MFTFRRARRYRHCHRKWLSLPANCQVNDGKWAGNIHGGKVRMLGPWGDRLERRVSRRVAITLVITLSVVVGATSYALVVHLTRGNAPSACPHRPDSGTSLLSGP